MRIVCPDCRAAYEVPEQRLAPGKAVRCARCGHEWAPVAAAPIAVPEAAVLPPAAAPAVVPPPPPLPPEVPAPVLDEPKLFAAPRLAAYRPRNVDSVDDERPPPRNDDLPPPRDSGVMLGWVASLVVLVALGWAGFAFRVAIMAAWPPSQRLYVALGLH